MTPIPSGSSLIMSTSEESVARGLMSPTMPRYFDALAGQQTLRLAAARPNRLAFRMKERRVIWERERVPIWDLPGSEIRASMAQMSRRNNGQGSLSFEQRGIEHSAEKPHQRAKSSKGSYFE